MLNKSSRSEPRVAVVMAVRNGFPFLKDQIQSVLSQKNVKVALFCIDDGSTDGSLEVLRELHKKSRIVYLETSRSLGYNKVFRLLMEQVKDYEFVSFCDQDDIWNFEKLEKMIGMLGTDRPELVVCKREFINAEGYRDKSQPSILAKRANWPNSAIENVAPGNCQVMNSAGLSVVRMFAPREPFFYDHWNFLILSLLGSVHFVDSVLVHHRVHGNNATTISNKKRPIVLARNLIMARSQLLYFRTLLVRPEVMNKSQLNSIEIENCLVKINHLLRHPLFSNATPIRALLAGLLWWILGRRSRLNPE